MKFSLFITFILLAFSMKVEAQTYAEKLGWKAGQKLLIMHVDDAGMSYDSNQGAIQAMENGIANSVSIMMPCPWAASFVKYVQAHPETDAGLHLTLTSEWKDYRWHPLSGIPAVPGLVDEEGAMWHTVELVATHASPDEVEQEIRQQVERALRMGYQPTHLDSHMGTLFATDDFLQRYIKVGVDYDIPVMLPGGHNTLLKQGYREQSIRRLKETGQYKEEMEVPLPEAVSKAGAVGEMVWDAGLPVLDDLHTISGDWTLAEGKKRNEKNIHELKVQKFKELFENMQPGVTMVIVHCTDPTEVFPEISSSGLSRKGDLLAMMDPRLKQYLKDNNIQLTTWRELKARRDRLEK
ncbi:polysaccharide deacetylase family protein [Catalinimonas niigatensis]|uniref:polysaccharide deacetylase family protein n=1 Tax=Catalinimonas niigatensis TaxID=1397264 RepID=UPI0026667FA2|nr:polysaccharide deacetylase family protein [Catalinimonas niigatensis]WPP50454.1 polysaccharide deacetylase family protein [Catalinimonas niigatensis]